MWGLGTWPTQNEEMSVVYCVAKSTYTLLCEFIGYASRLLVCNSIYLAIAVVIINLPLVFALNFQLASSLPPGTLTLFVHMQQYNATSYVYSDFH